MKGAGEPAADHLDGCAGHAGGLGAGAPGQHRPAACLRPQPGENSGLSVGLHAYAVPLLNAFCARHCGSASRGLAKPSNHGHSLKAAPDAECLPAALQTGVDPTPEQWQGILKVVRERRLLPFLDSAYQVPPCVPQHLGMPLAACQHFSSPLQDAASCCCACCT